MVWSENIENDSEEAVLAGLSNIFEPETWPFFVQEIAALAEGKTYFEGETVVRTLKGDKIHVWLTLSLPSPERSGLALVTLNDITATKRYEAERHLLVRELGAAVHARDDFLSVASHELKTPLTPLRLKLEVLARDAQAQKENPFAGKVLRNAQAGLRQLGKLSTLIGDLLDVSRIAAERFTVHSEPTASANGFSPVEDSSRRTTRWPGVQPSGA